MIPLRRAGSALAALALTLAASVEGGAALARSAQPSAVTSHVDTSSITIDSVSPATIPTKGVIVLGGTVHNGSTTTWHHVMVTPQTSYTPRTTAADIAAAASLDPDSVLLRNTLVTRAVGLHDLAPGASARFTIRIPRAQLNITGAPGAYWLGVVPSSDESHPVSLTARTFLPLLPKVNKRAHLNVSLVVPLRDSPMRTTSGALADATGFATTLSPRGRLGRIAAFGEAAAGRPLTWMVDPALLDAADDLSRGTSPYAVGLDGSALPVPIPLPTTSGSATSTPTASSSPSASPTGAPTKGPSAAVIAARLATATWLQSVVSLLQSSAATYALPYADPDTAPLVATGHTNLLASAIDLSSQSLTARSVTSQPAVAPIGGSLSLSEWSALSAGQTAFVAPSAASPTRSVSADGRTVVVSSPASAGGPGPSNPTSALNVRQRILAEASVSLGQATTTNLTIVLPPTWDPGSSTSVAGFFAPLTQTWLSFTGLPTPTAGTADLSHAAPHASARQRANLDAALALRATAIQMTKLLATPSATTGVLTRQLDATALSTVSYDSERAPIRYRLNATRTVEALAGLRASVRVEGTHFVTLSGSSGVITVALHNGLNQPIRVGLRQTDRQRGSTVTVDPVAAITLDPGERSTLRVHLSAERVSVQEVTLTAVDAEGTPVGTPLTFTLRSSPVGAVVWAITIAIVLVLVLLVGRRVRRRLRLRRAPR